jgi:hypothetical protein
VEAGDGREWQGGALRGFGYESFLIYGMNYRLMRGRKETESSFHLIWQKLRAGHLVEMG